ncbi:hypothetical protein YC2023_083458 [Brassica napus]
MENNLFSKLLAKAKKLQLPESNCQSSFEAMLCVRCTQGFSSEPWFWEYAIASVLSFSKVFDDLCELRVIISFKLSYDLVVFVSDVESDDDEDDTEALRLNSTR